MSQISSDRFTNPVVHRSRWPDTGPRPATIVIAGAATFIVALWLAAYHPGNWDDQAVMALNRYAGHSAFLDRAMHALTTRELLQGVVFVSLLWFLWFDADSDDVRGFLLVGLTAAVAAGIVSRLIQVGLPIHLRPLHDPTLAFVPPIGVDREALNHFSCFPSDHGAVFFTLALVIGRQRRGMGLAALVWAAIVDIARVYDGYHFPTDLLGSIGLSCMILALLDNHWARAAAARVLRIEKTHGAIFYLAAFLLCYQVATLFDDAREIARGSATVLMHRDPFIVEPHIGG